MQLWQKAVRDPMNKEQTPPRRSESTLLRRVTPAALILVSAVLLLITRLLRPLLLEGAGLYIGVVVLQIMIFLLPASLWIRLSGDGYLSRLRLKPSRPESILLSLAAAGLLISGGLLLSMLFSRLGHLAGTFTLYETFHTKEGGFSGPTLYLVLAYAALPAITEELVFRGILCAEYERHGTSIAVLLSTLLFTLVHFNLAGFPVYLFAGFVLSVTTFLCRSVWGAILAHFIYNLFGLFGQPYIASFYEITGSTALFVFIVIAVFLFSLALFCGEAARLCRLYAMRNLPNIEVPKRKDGTPVPFRVRARAVLLKPDVFLLLLLSLASSILFLFL